jgi:hypothetical protein
MLFWENELVGSFSIFIQSGQGKLAWLQGFGDGHGMSSAPIARAEDFPSTQHHRPDQKCLS